MNADPPPPGDQVELGAQEVLDWLEGRLPPQRAHAMEDALARPDSPARAFADWAVQFRQLSAELPLVAPPPLVSQRLRAMFARRLDPDRPLARLVGRLEVDSRLPDPMVAVRGALLDAESRVQLTYTTEQADVVLDVEPTGPATVTLRGQVLPHRPMPGVFAARASGPTGTVSTIDGDDLGSFTLERVPVDSDLVVVSNDEISIELPLAPATRPT